MTQRAASPPEPTLYRKYRPQTFAEVVGQDHVVRVLTRAATEGKVAHAYLFAGPRGTGKTTIARLLAKRLNCERAKAAEPCNACPSCTAVMAGMHLDLVEIDAASNRGIDDIRSLKERIRLQPAHGHWKVYIVDEVHMLTKEAFNALLKTLEEPPPHALFALATTELERVPETVRSRCQTFVFRRAPATLIVDRLKRIVRAEGLTITPDTLHLLAVAAEGCFRDAESLLALVAGSTAGTVTVEDASALLGLTPLATIQDFVDALLQHAAAPALTILREVSTRGASFAFLSESLTRYLRALAAAAAAGVHGESFSPDEAARFQAQRTATPLTDLITLLRLTLRAKYELRDAVYEELPLELLALEWCSRQSEVPAPPPAAPRVASEERRARETVRKGGGAPAEVTAETPTTAASSQPATPPSRFTLERLLELWPAFVRAASSLHPLLFPMLHEAVPLAIRDGTLYALTNHALAHDRLKDPALRHPVEERLEEICGERLQLRLVRQRELPALDLAEPPPELRARLAQAIQETAAVEPSLTEALSMFGGEVVDKGTPAR